MVQRVIPICNRKVVRTCCCSECKYELAHPLSTQNPGKPRSCFTWIVSSENDRACICSQIGSTSGPSRSPAPSQPQHQTDRVNLCRSC